MKKIVAALLLISLQAVARPEVSIPATVEVSQRPALHLSDIAIVKDGSEELLEQLQGVVIRDDARELLLSQHFEANELLGKIRAAMQDNETLRKLNPSFKIPSNVKVTFAANPISKQEVERKIMNALKARCSECEYRLSIQSVPVPNNRQWELDFTQLTAKGGFLLPLRDSESRNPKWISGTIHVSRLTPVTTRMISQGERVKPEDLRMSMLDVTFAKDAGLRMEDIQGQLAARTLPVGSPVWTSDLRREPAAKKGQIVKALVGNQDFEITVNVECQDNGVIGDLVKVKNLDTQKVLSALVTDKGVVKLQ
ncbi:flagellar basal body P-ring formation chaperone FlgA [Bdellovibrio svalbardensis]|uniref:Flagellar basal body P-ring formation chaperone FlgA n=1 Tax=Bdellovibrio svalbardensis TaxID=2972972 RepID=A0ABT6DKE5_9BACT|nr:flagellar basal body P-ring formation chaperone FlgA [Bdellovibrio svalbardensis]MDG0817014.1 flagellar basal body P-ring formation chaperone FlgA [Bdellovibrio svalbardensis]